MLNINLACGRVFVDSPDWLNFDFAPASPTVRKANLLGRLPVADGAAALVYSSHFLEHVPRDLVPGFLRECWRVLRPGGVVRLVLPDLENLAREYLVRREAGEHDKADFVVLEMIDQCVRRESGGELGQLYRRLSGRQGDDVESMIDYIRARTGEDLRALPAAGGGGILPKPPVERGAWTPRTRLDSPVPAGAARGFPGAKRQSGRGGRAAPLAVGFPSAQGGARRSGLRGRAALQRQHQHGGRFPIPSARPRCRRLAAQGSGVDVRGGAQTRLMQPVTALRQGGRGD